MAKFRKKSVEVEALQYVGGNEAEINEFMGGTLGWHPTLQCPVIHTLGGDHLATKGDWIIKGVMGEFYPCKPGIFEMTYQAA